MAIAFWSVLSILPVGFVLTVIPWIKDSGPLEKTGVYITLISGIASVLFMIFLVATDNVKYVI